MADSAIKLPVKSETPSSSSIGAPWRPFESLRHEIDRLFDTFGLRTSQPLLSGARLEVPGMGHGWGLAPAVDITETEKEYEISVELPGIDAKQVDVTASNGLLTIKGEKKEEKEQKEKDYYLSERRYGSFIRTFRVPEGVDPAKIEATFTNGILAVRLPKSPEAKPSEKKIEVKVV